MTCKGICIRHKAVGRYINGHKRCQICNLFIKWDGIFCPCCSSRLRTGPRNIEDKARLRKQRRIQEEVEDKDKDPVFEPYISKTTDILITEVLRKSYYSFNH